MVINLSILEPWYISQSVSRINTNISANLIIPSVSSIKAAVVVFMISSPISFSVVLTIASVDFSVVAIKFSVILGNVVSRKNIGSLTFVH